jgi:hypothetical protein
MPNQVRKMLRAKTIGVRATYYANGPANVSKIKLVKLGAFLKEEGVKFTPSATGLVFTVGAETSPVTIAVLEHGILKNGFTFDKTSEYGRL